MAMAARRERGLLDPNADEGASPFDHHVYAVCCDGDLEEGVSGEASSIAGTQELGNLTLIYDANRISIEGDTDIAFTEDVAKRYEAYGWHVQTVDWTHDGTELPSRTCPQLYDAIRAAEAVTDQPSFIVLRTIIAWPAPNAQGTGKPRTAPPSAPRRSPPPRRSSASTPSSTFEVPGRRPRAHPRAGRPRPGGAGRLGPSSSGTGRPSRRPTPPCSSG